MFKLRHKSQKKEKELTPAERIHKSPQYTCILFHVTFLLSLVSFGQKSFELTNDDAIVLDKRHLKTLFKGNWVIQKEEMYLRQTIISSSGRNLVRYYSNHILEVNKKKGTWELIENKYLNHKLDNQEHERDLRFGGIFSVTSITDSTLTLVKLLTSSHDMKRTIFLKTINNRKNHFSNTKPAKIKMARKKEPKVRNKARDFRRFTPFMLEPDERQFELISQFSDEELLEYGFDFVNDTIYIQIKDSLYKIKRVPKQ